MNSSKVCTPQNNIDLVNQQVFTDEDKSPDGLESREPPTKGKGNVVSIEIKQQAADMYDLALTFQESPAIPTRESPKELEAGKNPYGKRQYIK